MQYIIPNGEYTLNPSAQTIALTDTSITLEKILSVRNITLNMDIYNSQSTGTHKLVQESTPGLFSYTYSGTMVNTDVLQICVENDSVLVDDSTPVDINVTNITSIPVAVDPLSPIVIDDSTPVDVNVTNPNLMNLSDVLAIYASEVVAISSTTSSTAKDTRNVSYANIFIKNATSTNLTVNVYGSPDVAGTFKVLIGTATLNTTTTQAEIAIENVPNYLFFDLINADASNAATVSISVQRTISTDVVRPYADVLEVYSSESVGTSSTTSSTGQDVRGAAYVIPYVKNATSTALTVNIYGSYNLAGTIKSLIRSYALTDVITQAGDPITTVPNYLFFDLVNADASNAATVDVSVQRG